MYGVREKLVTDFFLVTYSDEPSLLSGVYFLGFFFNFLKKMYSIFKILVLNNVIFLQKNLSD